MCEFRAGDGKKCVFTGGAKIARADLALTARDLAAKEKTAFSSGTKGFWT